MNTEAIAAFAKIHRLSPEDLEDLAEFLATGAAADYSNYNHIPVGIQEFVQSSEYLNSPQGVYPTIMPDLVAMNAEGISEIVLTGGIGAGKTTLALYTQAYQLYLLSCLIKPHDEFGLEASSEILIVFQSINANLAKQVDYKRFKAMVEGSKYFKENFPFDKSIESRMVFRNRIEVVPVSGLETAAIGQNVIGGIIDEVNFMAMVENSKNSTEGRAYDQATSLYNSIAGRRKSRFLRAGKTLPGRLCLVSSRRFPGQFTDKKEEEAKTDPSIYIYDKRVWEIKPPGTYSGEFFPIFIGDEHRNPRVLTKGEFIADEDRPLIDHIPVEFLNEFRNDISKALRDIAGRSTLAIHPYMLDREAVSGCFGKRSSVFVEDVVDFVTRKPKVRMQVVNVNPGNARWAHIDLGLTSDSAGLVIGHVPRFATIQRADVKEVLPVIQIDGVLEIKPPRNGEIDFASIRRILYKLRDMGMPIIWVSMDSYQSADSMQILRQGGFSVGYQSMDTSTEPYDICKQALYDGRVEISTCPKLLNELLTLERNLKKNKIDHNARGSKDLSDALAGVVAGLTLRREVWWQHNIAVAQAMSVSSIMREREVREQTSKRVDKGHGERQNWRSSE